MPSDGPLLTVLGELVVDLLPVPAACARLQLDRAGVEGDRPARAAAARGRTLISVRPNIRPMPAEGPVGGTLGNTAPAVGERLDRLIALADVVKVSSEDLGWLEPDTDTAAALDEAAQRWADRGPGLVILTDGGQPFRIARPGHPLLRRQPLPVTVADTVGADPPARAELETARSLR